MVVRLERLGRLARRRRRGSRACDASSAWVTSAPSGTRERQHELRRVQHLDRQAPADLDLRRVLRVERRVRAEAARMPPSTARRRSRAAARMSAGVTTLPFDFDIFLRSGSTMKPEIAASVHGARPSSSALRSIVEKSHVRMMSCPCGRRSNGATRFHSSASRSQPPASCGVSDEVAQVSKMSSSASNPPGDAALVLGVARGHVARRVDRQLRGVGREHARRSRARRSRRARTRRGSARRRSAGARRASRRSGR